MCKQVCFEGNCGGSSLSQLEIDEACYEVTWDNCKNNQKVESCAEMCKEDYRNNHCYSHNLYRSCSSEKIDEFRQACKWQSAYFYEDYMINGICSYTQDPDWCEHACISGQGDEYCELAEENDIQNEALYNDQLW